MPQRVSSGAHPPHRGMSPKVHQHNGQRNPKKPQSRNKDARFSDSDSESGSGSASSRCSSSAGSPPTSVSDHRGRGHLKTHGHVRGPGNPPHPHGSRHERPREHGQNGGPRPQHVPVSPHRAPRAPGPPYPPIQEGSVASHIERIRDDAYLRGRLAERSDARLVEELAQSKMHAQRRPHINQEQSPRRLFMLRTDMDDVPRQFARLSVDDDGVDDVILRREDARRRREFEYRAQRGSILDEDPFEGPPSPSSYTTYSTDGRRRGLHIMEIPDRYSPSPRPRRVRAYY
jgi:hypothetical protein